MLVLTRRPGESVMIGQDIVVTVVGVKGSQVQLGIAAPKAVPVHREEIYERIKRQTQRQHSLSQPGSPSEHEAR